MTRFVGGPLDGEENVPIGVQVQTETTGTPGAPRYSSYTEVQLAGHPSMRYVLTQPTDGSGDFEKVFEWHERGWLSPDVRTIREAAQSD